MNELKPSEIKQPNINIITSPGKFEGEHEIVPSLWDVVMNGCELESYNREIDDVLVSVVELERAELEKYPELKDYAKVELWESNDGFIFADFFPTSYIAKEWNQ